ncbi:MAG: RAMP superfamily CRISPR-associated protein [Brevinematia bacterium]|jgi:CRISPR/Cas system CMR subunit Cmr6 (Cas7 group RAMP superfamily)
MSERNIQVEVIRKEFTPREYLLQDRFNLTLKFEALVPENSYIFSGAIPKQLPEVKIFYNNIDKLKRRILSGEKLDLLAEIKRLLNEIDISKRMFEKNKYFPKLLNSYFIPGSSIKGAARSRIEYKLKPTKLGNSLVSYSCYITESPFLDKLFARNHLMFWGEDTSYFRSSCKVPNVCIVCDLFGTQSLASRVSFSDALLASSTSASLEFLKDLSIEAIKPNSKFILRVDAINLNFIELGLLFLGFEIFSGSPILVGSFKYRYNPKVTKNLYRNRFSFGLLKFNLIGFDEFLSNKLSNMSTKELIEKAKEELLNSEMSKFVDYSKGVIS